MWRAISIARQPKTILSIIFCKHCAFDEGVVKNSSCCRSRSGGCLHTSLGSGSCCVCAHFSSEKVMPGAPYHKMGRWAWVYLNNYRDIVNGGTDLSIALASNDPSCDFSKFLPKISVDIFLPWSTGPVSVSIFYHSAGRFEISSTFAIRTSPFRGRRVVHLETVHCVGCLYPLPVVQR